MNPLKYPVQSVDGFGEHSKTALERDRTYENRLPGSYTRQEDYLADEKARLESTTYGSSTQAKSLSSIVEGMLIQGCNSSLRLKAEIDFNMSPNEALTEACIGLGLSDEGYSVVLQDQGNQVDVQIHGS